MKAGTRKSAVAAVVACLVHCFAVQAQGIELWASDDGEYAWELSGFVKEQTLVMNLYRPPNWMAGMFPDADLAGQQFNKLRLRSKLFLDDVTVHVEFETRLSLSTDAMEQFGSVGAFSASSIARPRMWDIDSVSSDGLVWENDLDRATVKFPLGPADFTIGRQAITWGSAWFWKPSDRFSPFSPMDVDPDIKRGVDGLRGEFFIDDTSSIDVIGTFEWHEDDPDEKFQFNAGARFRTTFEGYDLAISAALFRKDIQAGLEFTGKLWDVGFRGEAVYVFNYETEQWDIEGVIGGDYRFPTKTLVASEFFYNGYGTDDNKEYLEFFLPDSQRAERLVRGEAFNIGRYYVGVMVQQELHPLVQMTLSGITNLLDPSSMIVVGLRWSMLQNARLTAGYMQPVGWRPDDCDPLELPSEFGFYPAMGYAVLKVAF